MRSVLRSWGPPAFYLLMLGWWLYIADLARRYPADAGFIFWLVAISGIVLTSIRWFQFARGRTRVVHQEHAEGAPTSPPDTAAGDQTRDEESTVLSPEARRRARVLISFVAILVGMQVIGLHLVLPVFTVVYLFVWARVRSIVGLVLAPLALFLVIVLVFDYLLITPWPVSLLEEQVGLRWGRFFSGMLR